MMYKRMVVALDGSQLAERILPYARSFAKALKIPVYTAEGYAPDLGELWEQIRKESQEYLDKIGGKLRGEGLDRVSTVLLEGNAAEKIIDLAHKTPKSLIAMCTHGRTGVGRWVLGSVTDRVVRHSDDPVLVIRASS